jgi:hypothetical protein
MLVNIGYLYYIYLIFFLIDYDPIYFSCFVLHIATVIS